MTGTFIVTIVVCTMTGLTLIITGFGPVRRLNQASAHNASLEGGALTSSQLLLLVLGAAGEYIVSLSVIFFRLVLQLSAGMFTEKSASNIWQAPKELRATGWSTSSPAASGRLPTSSRLGVCRYGECADDDSNLIAILLLWKVIKAETNDYFHHFYEHTKSAGPPSKPIH